MRHLSLRFCPVNLLLLLAVNPISVAFYDSKPYDRAFFEKALQAEEAGIRWSFHKFRLSAETAPMAKGAQAVCVFVNDVVDAACLEVLKAQGVTLVALRCAGFNNVDLAAAARLGVMVVRVPGYSPHAVAEHTVGLILALNRRLHRAYNRVREGNFSLDGLLGFDLHGKTAGIIGTGQIGAIVARILGAGFGCKVLAHDPFPNAECERAGVMYVTKEELLERSDIVTLHCPMTAANHHVINAESLAQMKDGVMLINTGRGGLVDTRAAITALKSGKLGWLGLDVYEGEAGLFFEDHSSHIIGDDLLSRLLTFPNVLITGHQAFFTKEAMQNIAETTIGNIAEQQRTGACGNVVKAVK